MNYRSTRRDGDWFSRRRLLFISGSGPTYVPSATSGPANDLLMQAVLADAPAHYWRLNEPATEASVTDYGSSRYHLAYINPGSYTTQIAVTSPTNLFVYSGGPTQLAMLTMAYSAYNDTNIASKYSGAGASDRTMVASLMSNTSRNQVTIEAWYKADVKWPAATAPGSNYNFMIWASIASNNAASTPHYQFGISSGGVRVKMTAGIHAGLFEQISAVTNVGSKRSWAHVVYQLTGSQENVYINASLHYQKDRNGTMTNSTPGFWVVGVNSLNLPGGGNDRMGWNGALRDVAIWWSTIGSDRIAAHYNAGTILSGGL